jgi:hypothetical protein
MYYLVHFYYLLLLLKHQVGTLFIIVVRIEKHHPIHVSI